MSSINESKAQDLLKQPLEFLSSIGAARLARLPDPRRVDRNVEPDAWLLGPDNRRWPIYLPETIEQWIASTPDLRDKRAAAGQ